MTLIRAYGASVIGTSHVQNGKPCHDYHAYRILEGEKGFVACVSDGMGSARKAEIGSTLAATFVVDYLATAIDFPMTDSEVIALIKEAFEATHNRLQEEANDLDVPVKDLNATMLVYVGLEDRQFYGQVGDCCAIGKRDDLYEVIVSQQRGEYANQTFSICNLESVHNGIYKKTEHLYPYVAMMSDGIESISVSTKDRTVSALFYEPFFKVFSHDRFSADEVSQSLARFLSSKRINERTDDDKTLLFICFL